MRKLFQFIILLSLSFTLNSFAQTRLSGGQAYGWYVIDPVSIPGAPGFSDVFFIDDDTGWITSGTVTVENIFKTEDGAVSFSTQGTNTGINAIYMFDANTGYSGGGSGFVYNTADGGLNWTFFGTMATTLTDLDFATTTQGYACGNGGAVFSINTGGVTNLNSGQAVNFTGISSPSVDKVWICGGGSIMYYNGITFDFQIGPVGFYNAIYFINNQEGWVVGDNGLIGHTINGGNNWTSQINPDTNSLYDLFFLNANEGWAVGALGTILHTTNGGTTWNVEGAGLTTSLLTGVHFTSTTNGYVVGSQKNLLKFGEITSIENEEELPTEFSLSQNYPNPFNPSTKISFTIPQTSFTSLKIYDVLGNEITSLVNEEKLAGEYEVEFRR